MRTERPLRVAHFTVGRCRLDSANGVDTAVYHLARTQAGLGHHVGVFSLTPKAPLPIPGVEVVSTYPSRLRFSVPRALVTDIASWQPDVLHLHSVHVPANLALARNVSAVAYCVSIHGGLAPVAQNRNRWAKWVFRWLFERDYLRRAAFLHAISERDLDGLARAGVSNTAVVAPNGIDVKPLPPDFGTRPLSLDERFRGNRIFLFLGRLDTEVKGLDMLLRAFAATRPAHTDLVLVGPDWRGGQRQLEALAGALGISDAVVFAGAAFGRAKIDWLRSADVLVQPSRTEAGVPFSVLEAAALGRPCLVTSAADPNGVLARAGATVTVEPTVDAIAAGLRRLSAAPAGALREMGALAHAVVAKEFSWRRSAEILIDAYRTHAVKSD